MSAIPSEDIRRDIERERDEGRKRQARKVMPLIGPLLDEWDGLPNDVSGNPELKGVRGIIRRIERAMEGA
jgi:hypothetical protein